jgi:N-acetylglutamate synthase-like GNAT family acetyltransferase
MAKAPDSEALPTALAFLRRTAALAADHARSFDAGCVVRTPSLPLVWALNHLRVAGPVTYERVVALAEQDLGDLPYRQLAIEHWASAELLEAPLRADGYKPDRELLMALARPAASKADVSGVVEADQDAVSALMRRWVADDPTMTPETLDQVVAATAREGCVRAARNFSIRDEAGEVVAMTKLYSDGVTAQVEDVYTMPEWRNHGCARRLINRAIAVALEDEHELVFIVADDDGWPKHLYSQMGFDPIGRMAMFHRDL